MLKITGYRTLALSHYHCPKLTLDEDLQGGVVWGSVADVIGDHRCQILRKEEEE